MNNTTEMTKKEAIEYMTTNYGYDNAKAVEIYTDLTLGDTVPLYKEALDLYIALLQGKSDSTPSLDDLLNLTPEMLEANRSEMMDYIMHTYGIADDQTALGVYNYISFDGKYKIGKVDVDMYADACTDGLSELLDEADD